MQKLAQAVLASIRRNQLMRPGDRVGVAVSGGADSVALFRLLLDLNDELGVVLSVVHFNHHIRGADSDADEAFVRELAKCNNLDFYHSGEDVPSYAAAEHLSLEAAARRLRYCYFESLLRQGTLDRIATAHTLDDQAETVLLRLIRGAGTRGLAGIFPVVEVRAELPAHTVCGRIIRPLLEFRRRDLEAYLLGLAQPWRDDPTNLDPKHARNRVRHKLLPLLETEFSPAIRERLAQLAEIAREEEDYWQKTAHVMLLDVLAADHSISVRRVFTYCPLALRRRILRFAAESAGFSPEFEQVEEARRLAESPSGGEKRIMLGDGWCVARTGDRLWFERCQETRLTCGYEYTLPVPGRANVLELDKVFEAAVVPRSAVSIAPDQMLATNLVPPLTLRNWRPGDRFHPAHHKSPKKLKELLQAKHIPISERHLWPVILSGDEIVWVRGFPCPAHHLATEQDAQVLLIRELPL